MSQIATPSVFHNPNQSTKASSKPTFLSKKNLLIILGLIILILFSLATYYTSSQTQNTSKRQATYFPPETYIPDQVVIKYKEGKISPQLDDFDRKAGVTSKEPVFKGPEDKELSRFYILYLQPGSNVIDVENLYLKQGYIEETQPNFEVKAFADPLVVPNDPLYSNLWGMVKIQMPQAWGIQKGSTNVSVGIVDSGIDRNHPDLPGNVTGYNAVTGSSNAQDDFSHGTHVAGTIAAIGNNNTGVTGVNWNVTLKVVKALDSQGRGSDSYLVNGIKFLVDQGVKVINLSLGGPPNCSMIPTRKSAIEYATSRGVLVVTAAGNDRADTNNFSPASCDGVLNVGNSTPGDQRFTTSNFGNKVHIAAPGTSILSTRLIGHTIDPRSDCQVHSDSNYMFCGGTSMAAPHVTGVAALLFAQNPTWTAQQVKDCLLSSADPISTDFPIGGKRLNAYKALTTCGSSSITPPPPPTITPPPPINLPPPPVLTGCNITNASWNPSGQTSQGSIVQLNITTEGDCNGKQVEFEVWEHDPPLELGGDERANTKPANAIIQANLATSNWGAEWTNDCAGLCLHPEYYFVAKIIGGTSTKLSPLLEVIKIPAGGTLPPPPIGNVPPPPVGGSTPPPPGNNPPSSTNPNPPSDETEQPTPLPELQYTCQNPSTQGTGQQLQIRQLLCNLLGSAPIQPAPIIPPNPPAIVPPTITPPANRVVGPPANTLPCTSNRICQGSCVNGQKTCNYHSRPDNLACNVVPAPSQSCTNQPPAANRCIGATDQCVIHNPACSCALNSIMECRGGRCISVNGNPANCTQMFHDQCRAYLSCAGDGLFCFAKPVIYLYPTKTIKVDVSVQTSGQIVVSDPLYPIGGWKNVIANPNGILYYEGEKYRELFYETSVTDFDKPKNGILIKSSDLKADLDNYITRLGLTRIDEREEFLDFWVPRLQQLNKPYILFSVIDKTEKDKTDKINISPKPDTFIEFIAYFKPLDQPISVPNLKLPTTPPQRIGFTAVEWGGVIDDK